MKKVLLMLLFTVAMHSQTQSYSASTENFANPERGWYKYSKGSSTSTFSSLNQSTLSGYRSTDKITLILRIYDLGAFKTTPISAAFLNNIQNDFNVLRSSGLKAILRFRYTESNNVDATKAQILSHIDQLKAITVPNQDVISHIEAGFIANYGEWWDSANFGTYNLTAQNLADRKAVGLKILELAPKRMVAFRTPAFQTLIGGTTSITSNNAYNGSVNSRIALHNDAFLGSSSDEGTYSNTNTQFPYLENQSKFTFSGGESNQLNTTYQNCTNALFTLNRFHYNYLNFGYYQETLDLWETQGCFDEVQKRLGYRFELLNSTINNDILTVNLQNVGFSNVFNQRNAYLILRNSTTNTEYSFQIDTDVRLWQSGSQTQLTQNLNLDVPAGNYQLFLNLPDLDIANPLYAIRCANSGTWDAVKGYNNLNQTYTKGTGTTLGTTPVVGFTPVVTLPVQIILSNNSIIMVSNLPSTNFTVEVYNLNGKLKSTSVDISNLRKGVYIVKVNSNNLVFTQKIVKV